MYFRRSTFLGTNGAVYFLWQILFQSIVPNHGCCFTSLTLLGRNAVSLDSNLLRRSSRKTSLVLFDGILTCFKSGRFYNILRIVPFVSPLGSMKGGAPVKNSKSRQPNAQRSDCPLYCCLVKNSGGKYSSVPNTFVVKF